MDGHGHGSGKRKLLIELRKKRDWTQYDVVEKLKEKYGIEITAQYYGMLEKGVRTPSLGLALAIAKLFHEDVEKLFFETTPNKMLV